MRASTVRSVRQTDLGLRRVCLLGDLLTEMWSKVAARPVSSSQFKSEREAYIWVRTKEASSWLECTWFILRQYPRVRHIPGTRSNCKVLHVTGNLFVIVWWETMRENPARVAGTFVVVMIQDGCTHVKLNPYMVSQKCKEESTCLSGTNCLKASCLLCNPSKNECQEGPWVCPSCHCPYSV